MLELYLLYELAKGADLYLGEKCLIDKRVLYSEIDILGLEVKLVLLKVEHRVLKIVRDTICLI